jgi:transposase-like protein
MTEKRQTYTAEVKREAVRLVPVYGDGVAVAARNVGRNATRLGRWQGDQEAREARAFPGKGRWSPESATRHRLREAHQRLRMARAILPPRWRRRRITCERWSVAVRCEVRQVSRSGL